MKISFAKLSTEECETCRSTEFTHIKNDDDKCIDDCEGCLSQREHDQLKIEARQAYQSDASEVREVLW